MALPLYLMVIQSIKPIEELFLWPPRFYVMRPTLENYTDLVLAASRTWVPFTRYVFNSLFVTSVSVVLYVIICCMAAYPLAKMRKMPFAATIFNACLAALMFAPQVTVIPRYLTVAGLGYDRYLHSIDRPRSRRILRRLFYEAVLGAVPRRLA